MNKTYSNLIRKAFASFKILALGILLLFAAATAKGQQNLNMLAYGPTSISMDVSVLTSIFGDVTINGVVRTTDTAPNNSITNLATSVSAYANIQAIYINALGIPAPNIISQAQADALVAFVKQGGILIGSMERVVIDNASGTEVNKYIGEKLLIQPGVTIVSTWDLSTVPNPVRAYHNNGGPLNLNASATSVITTTSSYVFSGIPRESVVFSFVKPTSAATCGTPTLDFIAPSYPGDVNAKAAGINGFAYLSGEVQGPLTGDQSPGAPIRDNTQANTNLALMMYDFLYTPAAMITRRAWSKTAANVNSFCPVSTTSLECSAGYTAPPLTGTALSNTCPTTTVNLNSLHTATVPSGSSLVWFNNITHAGTAVSTPAAVGTAGTYYAFYYDSTNNCYSPASNAVNVTINCCLSTGPSIN